MSVSADFCRHEIDVHSARLNQIGDGDQDEYGYFNCNAGCGYVYRTKAARNRSVVIIDIYSRELKHMHF